MKTPVMIVGLGVMSLALTGPADAQRVPYGNALAIAVVDDGGLPLPMDGKVMGAVGVSGETGAQDAQVAKACVDNIGK
jgi:uncharacterized protein GlcG (DUF336 family)